jgi:hypothetical protein
MKKIIILFTLGILIIGGCSDKSLNVVEPQQTEQEELNRFGLLDDLLNPVFTVVKLVNGIVGGTINLTHNVVGASGVQGVSSKLTIPPLAFIGIKPISMTAEINKASFVFGPHMNFNKKLELTATFYGVDLSKLPEWPGNLSFGYIAEDGSFTPCPNSGMVYDPVKKTLFVYKAKIDHFSRYGWVK